MVICDLGIVKLRKAAEATHTCSGKGPGTIPYMAPEMFHKAPRGRAVDIYSLGCLFSELFSKRRVWSGLGGREITGRMCGAFGHQPIYSPPDMSHLAEPFCKLCQQCCQLDSSMRPSITDVLEMLSKISTDWSVIVLVSDV